MAQKCRFSQGCNDDYPLGRIDQKDEGVPRKVTALTEEVVEISAGACHSAVLTKGGDVYSWGTYKDSNGHIGFKIGNDKELVFKQQLPDLMVTLTSHSHMPARVFK
jgi:alpha-tubulin suppressor-like RCC1 family protein